MSTENSVPNRRSGPHAPLPNASIAAAVSAALPDEAPQVTRSAPVTTGEEDPRVRAARRAAELRDHGSLDEDEDKFKFDLSIIPDGWSYEWKMLEVLGKADPSYQVNIARKGWEAVPRSRHPEMMPDNYAGNTIVRDGMILCERPLEITEAARRREYQKARDQVRGKEEQLGASPPGTFERSNKDSPLAKVTKNYEAIPIPE